MAKNVTLEAVIKLKDEFSSKIKSIEKSIGQLQKSMQDSGKAAKPLSQTFKTLQTELKHTAEIGKHSFKHLEEVSGHAAHHIKTAWLTTVAKITGALLAFREAFDIAQEAAKAEQAFQAFALTVEQHGAKAAEIFEKMKEASGGLVSNHDLVMAANQAIALGIPIEKLGKLMEIARYRARLFGSDVSQAFSDIVTGIGRMSPMILDNLGITIKLGEAYEDYAKQIHKTVDQLTAQEQKQAVLNAVLKQSEKTVKNFSRVQETSYEKFQRMQATLENIREELGIALIPLFEQFAQLMNETLGSLLPYFEKVVVGWRMIVATLKMAFKDMQILYYWAQDKFSTSWDTISQMLNQNTFVFKRKIRELKKELDDLTQIHSEINWESFTHGLPKLKMAAEIHKVTVSQEAVNAMQDILNAIEDATAPDIEKEKKKWDKWKDELLKKAREAKANTALLEIELDNIVAKKKAEIEDKYRKQQLQKDVQIQTQIAEATLQRMQKVLDYQNRLGEIDKKRYLQKRLEILKERLRVLQWQIKNTFDPVQTQMIANRIADINGQLAITQRKLQDLQGTIADALKKGLQDAHNKFKVTMDDWRELSKNTAQSLQSAFSDFFFDAMQGKLKSLEAYFKSFAQAVMRYIADILAKMTAMKLLEGVGGIFGVKLPSVHTGGVVTAQGIKKFHDGGIVTRSDEVPAILQVGEVVLSRNQVAALASAKPKIEINVKNETGVPFDFDVARLQQSREAEVVNIIVKRLQIDPAFKQLVRGS